jgi:hypothetical protein
VDHGASMMADPLRIVSLQKAITVIARACSVVEHNTQSSECKSVGQTLIDASLFLASIFLPR